MAYDYKGVVEEVGETKSFGANNFTKRELIVGNDVDTQSRYPNPVLFTFKRENCSMLDAVKKGDRVNVHFVIDGRRWDGPNGVRYFTDLTGLRIDVLNADGSSTQPLPQPAAAPEMPPAATAGDLEDLPF